MKRQRGVALLLVLWVLALLSLLLGGLAGWVQLQTRQAAWHRQHAQALMAAEAGMNLAVQGLLDPSQREQWVADGRERVVSFAGAALHIRVYSERGKLDLTVRRAGEGRGEALQVNGALLARLLAGEDPLAAARYANAAAALSTTGYGAVAPIPREAAVRALLGP